MSNNDNFFFRNDNDFYKNFQSGDSLAVYHPGYEYLFSKLINTTTLGKFDHLLKLFRPDSEGTWISEQTVGRGCVYEKITWRKFKQRFLSDKVNVYHGRLNNFINVTESERYARENELQKYGFAKLLDEAPILNLFSPFSYITKNKEICSMHVALCDEQGFKDMKINVNPITEILKKHRTLSPTEYVKITISENLYSWNSLTDRYNA